MNIVEITESISPKIAKEIQKVFSESFGEDTSPEFLERVNEKKDLSVILAYVSSELVGFKIGYTKYRGVFFSWLGAVSPSHQRNGIARVLLKHQHEYCASKQYNEVQTEAHGNNKGMLILNLQEGFSIFGSHMGHNNELSIQFRKNLAK